MILVNLFEPGYKPNVTGWSGLLAISLKLVHQSCLCVECAGEGGSSSVTSHVLQNLVVWDSKDYVVGFCVLKSR